MSGILYHFNGLCLYFWEVTFSHFLCKLLSIPVVSCYSLVSSLVSFNWLKNSKFSRIHILCCDSVKSSSSWSWYKLELAWARWACLVLIGWLISWLADWLWYWDALGMLWLLSNHVAFQELFPFPPHCLLLASCLLISTLLVTQLHGPTFPQELSPIVSIFWSIFIYSLWDIVSLLFPRHKSNILWRVIFQALLCN